MKVKYQTVAILIFGLSTSNTSFAGYQAACFNGELQIMGQQIKIQNIYKSANAEIANLESALTVIKSCGDQLLIQAEQTRLLADAYETAATIYHSIQVDALKFQDQLPGDCNPIDFIAKSAAAAVNSEQAKNQSALAIVKTAELIKKSKSCKN